MLGLLGGGGSDVSPRLQSFKLAIKQSENDQMLIILWLRNTYKKVYILLIMILILLLLVWQDNCHKIKIICLFSPIFFVVSPIKT